ncbi:Arylsulfatase [Planctomycetes bacterium Pla163]|uniref:Arylsulfatase n=1 Tax=Rohdeia mirabilis TaxID=2528008 RepID=A0A518CXG0_9BACT|nr:Arylsulfatase [Planctomycetes bacterium Pla163]
MSTNTPSAAARPTRAVCAAIALLVAVGCSGTRRAPSAADLAAPAEPQRPNVVVVLADDLGWGELGCYGQERIPTPAIDALAARGVRFTQGYSGSPVCAPSRCVLLTGRHTGHATIRNNTENGGLRFGPDALEGQTPLPAGEWTVARELHDAGYRTGFVGKWGLGGPDTTGHPLDQGFDRFYGILCQRKAHGFYPTHLWSDRDREPLAGNAYLAEHQKLDAPLSTESEYYERYCGTTYAPDRIIDEAVAFVETAADEDAPFFLVYASPIPHVALQVPPTELDAFPRDWDTAPYLGEGGYVPHPRPRAAYAAMIARLDRQVGRLVEALERTGELEHTLVVFTSDNGPTYAGGVDAEFFDSAGGLRGLKGSVFEGGVRVPFVASLPGVIEPGSTSEFPCGFQDLAPTVLELAGRALPSTVELDGESLVPVLRGAAPSERRTPLYWELGRQQAVRVGDLKAVRTGLGSDSPKLALFDLAADPAESTDLAPERPDLVARFERVFEAAREPSTLFPLRGVDRP